MNASREAVAAGIKREIARAALPADEREWVL